MKKIIVSVVFAVSAVFGALAANVQSFQTEDMDVKAWIESNFRKGVKPPFSFELGDRKSDDVILKWKYSAREMTPSQPGETAYQYSWTDPVSGMQVVADVKGYQEYDTVEWVLHFINTGVENSETLKNVRSVDVDFRYAEKGNSVVLYADGTHVSKQDFHPRTKQITAEDGLYMSPMSGRSSDRAFPFFEIKSPSEKQGVIVAVGWTGTWYANIAAAGPKTVSLDAGMKTLETYLYPGEEIRTPSTCFVFWSGDDKMLGHNKFRRMMYMIQTPKVDGKPVHYPVSNSFNYGDPYPCNEYTCMTESYALALVERYKDYDIIPDTFWLDAGWYIKAKEYYNNKNWANTVGNWIIDPERFPNGFKPIADAVHQAGAKFMVWFEPERVIMDSHWGTTMRGWMLDREGTDAYLYDLGNPEALDYLCKFIVNFMKENGIDYYRQDFNMDIDGFWRENDKTGRKGICEIRHIEGLYKFWEYILENVPGSIVDNCASGGRRIDFETMKRSAPMWRTDYNYGEPLGYQTHTYGLNFYLSQSGTGCYLTERFSFRSSLGTSVIFNWKITEGSSNLFEIRRCMDEFYAVQPYFFEDYYPLTTCVDMTSDEIWMAYQLHRPSDQTGYIVAFRRELCENDTVSVQLGGLEDESTYEFTDCDSGATFTGLGADLKKEMKMTAASKRESKLIKYKKL